MSFWVSVLLAGFVGVAVWKQRKTYILQYLFFMRYPLLAGLALLVLPLLASDKPDSIIRNFFVLEPVELVITSFLAVQAAWTVMYSFFYLWMRLPFRTELPFLREKRSEYRKSRKKLSIKRRYPPRNGLYGWFRPPMVRWILAMLMAVPLLIQCIRYATASVTTAVIWCAAGVIFAWVFLWISTGLRNLVSRRTTHRFFIQRFLRGVARAQVLVDRVLVGKDKILRGTTGFEIFVLGEKEVGFYPLNAVAFGVGVLLLYATGYSLFDPDTGVSWLKTNVPALAYIIYLLILLCWMLTWLSFQFDKYRLPPEIGLVAFAAISWGIFKADHFYRIDSLACPPPPYVRDFDATQLLSAETGRNKSGPIILIAASGGGIRAATWTATVLTGLAEQVPSFAESVRLISSASGGGLGAMYFVNAYTPNSPPSDLVAIRRAASQPSLAAMAWGLVYPDFLRFFLPFLPGPDSDRGWAQEARWGEPFDGAVPMLNDWREGVKEGWRPAVVFNSTITETGQQLMISNLDFSLPGEGNIEGVARVRSFRGLYPGADLSVVTAARLSATFPWVTPVSRPLTDCGDIHPYHIADGGYYDNFGITSIVQFLKEVTPVLVEREKPQVLIVSIRDYDTTKIKSAVTNAGFLHETLGPAFTMLAARTASQIARNDLDIALLQEKLKVEEVIFELKPEAPLSWRLSDDERRNIEGYFECPDAQAKVHDVARALNIHTLPPGKGKLEQIGCSPGKRAGVVQEE